MAIKQLYEHELTNLLLQHDISIFGNLIFHVQNLGKTVDDFLRKGHTIQCFAPIHAKAYVERGLFECMTKRRKRMVSQGVSGGVCYKMLYTLDHHSIKNVRVVVFYLFASEVLKRDNYFLHDALTVSRCAFTLRSMPEILDSCPNPLAKIGLMDCYYLHNEPIASDIGCLRDTLTYLHQEGVQNFHTLSSCKHNFTSKCSICLNVNRKKESMQLACTHSFHLSCFHKLVDAALQKNESPVCPMCRTPILPGEY